MLSYTSRAFLSFGKKKAKKVKNLGSRFPGGKGGAAAPAEVEAKPDGHLEGKDAEAIAIGRSKEEATS